jgi:Fur family zinc uptake transcriptional regulator
MWQKYSLGMFNISKDENSIPTMSVYRILEFLEAESLVHKPSSAKKHVACSHILGGFSQEITQF